MPVSNLPLPDRILGESVTAFWGGSTLHGDVVEASGGRVLTMCATGENHEQARERAYAACSAYGHILPTGTKLCCRSDIALRVVGARH